MAMEESAPITRPLPCNTENSLPVPQGMSIMLPPAGITFMTLLNADCSALTTSRLIRPRIDQRSRVLVASIWFSYRFTASGVWYDCLYSWIASFAEFMQGPQDDC